jgi:PA14 domain
VRRLAATLLLVLSSFTAAQEGVPPPAQTPAQVIVSGRTSTVKEIKTVAVGDKVPRTFSGDRVKNTKGFSWFVSQHYALKTDYPEARARFYLELLELAFPHYLELFGKEPPGLADKRMAVVYASSAEKLKEALLSDGIAWNFQGGGITFEGYFCAYQYPSGTLEYHQRYIVLHECAHLFQMCLNGTVVTTPGWYLEGVADSLGHHVYDEKKRQLTVHVFDKAAITNYLDDGLARHRQTPLSFEAVHKAGGAERAVNFLMVHYLSDDPERLQKFRIWRDEMFRLKQHGKPQTELSGRLLQDLFGPWPKLDADFRRWLAARRNTFHYVDWGWEQDGNALRSYGFAAAGNLSQTDVLLPPGEKASFDPLRMDYPAEPAPELVGPVRRGVAEPAVGCLIDFSRCVGYGRAGLGLGVVPKAQITPFPAAQLFADKQGKQPGVNVMAHELKPAAQMPTKSEDLKLGESLGESVDPTVGLGEKGSISRLVGKNFVLEWRGWLKIGKSDDHFLALGGNSGSWLWLDDQLVIDRNGKSGPATIVRLKLTAGLHPLRVRYYQRDGGKGLTVGFASQASAGGYVKLLIEAEKQLVLDGSELGLEKKVLPLPKEFRKALGAGGHRLGLTARIAAKTLDVTLRARDPAASAVLAFEAALPLDERSCEQLLTQPVTLLARDGYHAVTPFCDDARKLEPDLLTAAPPNRWRNSGDRHLAALYRASWRLGDHSPRSLLTLREQLLKAADQKVETQAEAVMAFAKQIGTVRENVRNCGAAPEVVQQALMELQQ